MADDDWDKVGPYTAKVITKLGYYPWDHAVYTKASDTWEPLIILDTENDPAAASAWRTVPDQGHPVLMSFVSSVSKLTDTEATADVIAASMVSALFLRWEERLLITPEGWHGRACGPDKHFHPFDVRAPVGETIYPTRAEMLAAWKLDPDRQVPRRPVQLTELEALELADDLADPRGLPPEAAERIAGWLNTPTKVNGLVADAFVHGFLVDNLSELVATTNSPYVLNLAAALLIVSSRTNRIDPIFERMERIDRSPQGRLQVAALREVTRSFSKTDELVRMTRELGELRLEKRGS